MADFWAGSGSAGNSLTGSLQQLAEEFLPAITGSRIGHLVGARIPGVAPSTRASFSYFKRNMYVNETDNNAGTRLIGEPVPSAQPGEWSSISTQLLDYGQQVAIDAGDGYVLGNMADELAMDELGVRLSMTHALDSLDQAVADVLTEVGGDNPWSSDVHTGSDWEAVTGGASTNNPLLDILGALNTHEGKAGNEGMTVGSIVFVCGSRVLRALQSNSYMTSMFGGNTGFGTLSLDQVRSALSTVGVRDILFGTDDRYGAVATLFQKPAGEMITSPSGRMAAGAGIICPFSGDGDLLQVAEPVKLDARRRGYYVYANCDPIGIVPEFGVTLESLYT